MPEDINLREVWDSNTFRVYRGKLNGRMMMEGSALGHGLVYYMGLANIQHLISGDLVGRPFVLSKTNKANKCMWNPGSLTQVRNVGTNAVELLRVTPKYRRKVIKDLPKDTLAAATALLVRGNWSESFKESVDVDLRADLPPVFGPVIS